MNREIAQKEPKKAPSIVYKVLFITGRNLIDIENHYQLNFFLINSRSWYYFTTFYEKNVSCCH
ncbi:hypothetical protein THF1C08_250083 [Vibrio jasicida]|uniref:Uncharacterized protein n=1 Tax=Vibrio jasicida TaxID=766224 RepID=A0AAU9QLV9_9VIBR|nr:hypothetical protein THF1C08_250083 [Vibrio jasicida]CAH1592610.1 hypothetical protein THF1A12_250084 [Vibrio jasicida]